MLNVSDISTWNYCKRLLFIRKKLKLKEKVQPKTLKGIALHLTNEYFYDLEKKALIDYNKHDYNFLLNIYRKIKTKAMKKILSGIRKDIKELNLNPFEIIDLLDAQFEDEIAIRSKEVFDYSKKNNLLGVDLILNLYPQIKTEVSIKDETLGLSGRIDRLLIYPDYYVPVEIKTSKNVYDSHVYQAVTYGLMLRHNGYNVKYSKILFDHTKEKIIYINPFHEIELKKIISEINEMLESSKVPDKVKNINKCNNCSFKEVCDSL